MLKWMETNFGVESGLLLSSVQIKLDQILENTKNTNFRADEKDLYLWGNHDDTKIGISGDH